MKIGIFTDTYLPDINGVASSSFILRNALVKNGHDVIVVTSELPKDSNYQDEGNIYRLDGIELKNLYEYRLSTFFSATCFRKIREMHLDVIHIQTEFSVGLFGKICAHLLNIPVVYTYHTQYEDYVHYAPIIGNIEPIQPLLKKAVSVISQVLGDNCTELVVPSTKTRDMMEDYGVKNHIHVIPTGLELEKFSEDKIDLKHLQEVKEECGIDDQHLNLIFLGRIAPEKSVDFIIQAISTLINKGIKVRFIVVGGGPGLDDLKSLSTSLNLDEHIYFAGPKNREEVPYYYHACDAFVCASVSETQGLTYIEALSCGLPVLARYDKNLETIIKDDFNGYFFNDQDQLVSYVEKLVSEDLSKFKTNCVEDSKQYSSQKFYESMIEVYQEAIDHKHYTYTISSIIPRQNQMCEVILTLDHQSLSVTLPEKFVLKHALENGMVIEHQLFREIQEYEGVVKGYKRALRYLTIRDYTKKEMISKLEKLEEYDYEQINRIIELLEEKHLIDDETFSNDFIDRAIRNGLGVNKAIQKLKIKGIDEAILDLKKQTYSIELEIEKAIETVQKLYHTNKNRSQAALQKYIRDKLFYKGYNSDTIEKAMNTMPKVIDESFEDELLDKEIEKAYTKYKQKYADRELKQKVIQYLIRKGFDYKKISEKIGEGDDFVD